MTGRIHVLAVTAAAAVALVLVGIAGATTGPAPLFTGADDAPRTGAGSADAGSDDDASRRPPDAGEVSDSGDAPPSSDDGGLPPVEREAPPAAEAPPRPASRSGARVDGFPAVIPLAPGSTIVSSAVTSDGGRVQATLDAQASAAPDDVLAHYRAEFAEADFHPTPAPSVGGSSALTFTNGPDTVVVTVAASSTGGTRYSVFGVFATDRQG